MRLASNAIGNDALERAARASWATTPAWSNAADPSVEKRYSPRWVVLLTGEPSESVSCTLFPRMSVLVTVRWTGGSPERVRAASVPDGLRPLVRIAPMASRAWPRK